MDCFFKRSVVIAIIFLLVNSFCACNNDSQILQVSSTDYDVYQLESSLLTNMDYNISEENMAYQCYVTKTNPYGNSYSSEKLVINNGRASHVQMCNGINGFFVGFDYSEFASGIYFIPCTGISNLESVKVLEERCVALFESNDSNDDNCYAVTSSNYYDEAPTSLYKLTSPSSDNGYTCTSEKICDITSEDGIVAIQTSNDLFMVVTYSGLYSISKDGVVTEFEVPEEWTRLQINSMVEIDGMVYMGTKYGVLEYDMQQNTFLWFPIEYDAVIQ